MATAARHREISATFLDHAEEEFRKGDMLQASEKAWGALAHHVKAVARERGWPNSSHDDLRHNIQALVNYTDDPKKYMRMQKAIDSLHTNFYEDKLAWGRVRQSINDTRELLLALRRASGKFPKRRPTRKQIDDQDRRLFSQSPSSGTSREFKPRRRSRGF